MSASKRIALMIAALTLTQPFVSCSDPESSATSSSPYESTSVSTPPPIEAVDLEGDTFSFLTYNDQATDYTDDYIWSDNSGDTAIGKAVSERNAAVEEMFNITVVTDEVHSPKYEAMLRAQSGQCDFDVIYEWGSRATSMVMAGLLYDFGELENVDLDRSYWIPSAREDLTVGGKMYVATNYITMNSVGWANLMYYNKTMYGELGHTDPLSDLVENKEWTFEKFVDLAVSSGSDLDGDGIMTSADRYGIWGDVNGCLTSLAKAAGIQNTKKTDDGSCSLSMYSEKAVDIYADFKNMLDQDGIFIDYEDIWDENPNLTAFASRYKGARFIGFGEGHVLFMPGTMDMTREFTEMEDDYGILPNPLYSPDQKEYYHFVDTNAPMFAIPAEGESIDTTGMILEYMAYKSEEKLLPVFYETIVKSKPIPDATEYKMLDIVTDSIKYEWTELYGLSVTNSIMSKMMTSGSFKSVYNRLSYKAKTEINDCITAIGALK